MKCELVTKTVGVNSYENLTAEEITAAIARHGVIKDDKGKLIKYLMDKLHWSPLQFINFTFKIRTKRVISTQIFRHTSLSVQERSTRYDETLGFEDIEFRLEHPTNRQSSTDVVGTILSDGGVFKIGTITTEVQFEAILKARKSLTDIMIAYDDLIAAGIAKECARDILPLATTTDIHINGNLRSLLAFLNVRCDKGAQKDIQEIATCIGEELEKELPNVFARIDWRNGMFM